MQKYKMLKSLPWMEEGLEFWIENNTINTVEMMDGRPRRTICAAGCYQATLDYYTNEDGEFEPDDDFIAKL
jgi:hypothetical protein